MYMVNSIAFKAVTLLEEENNLGVYFCIEDDMSSIENFLHLGIKRNIKKGDLIWSIGERIEYLYYLKKGKAGRLVTTENGTEKYFKVVCDGSILGEVVFFRHEENNGKFVAIEDCECYLFDEATVYTILLKNETVVRELIMWFCRRMQSLNNQLISSMTRDPHNRVYNFLYEYACNFGEMRREGEYVYEGKLSHYDIAKYLGMNRVLVTNVLKGLQEKNLIYKDRHRLIVFAQDYYDKI